MVPDDPPGPDEGGDPACWLHLFDDEPAGDGDAEPGDVEPAEDSDGTAPGRRR